MQRLIPPDRGLVDDLVKEFLAESREGLDRMDVCLTALEGRPGDKDLLGEIFRAVHTMKGATGFLGYPRLERLTHTGEGLLSLLRDGVLVADPAIIDGLFQLMDRLREVIGVLERSGREGNRASDDDSEVLAMLQRLHPESDAQASAPPPDVELQELMLQAGVIPASGDGSDRSLIAAAPMALEAAFVAHVQALTPGVEASDQVLALRAERGTEAEAPHKFREGDGIREADLTVRVDVQVLDRMVHLVGELVLTRNQLAKNRAGESGALEAAERLDSLTQELRQTVIQARMLPLSQLFQRFPRMVRDLAKTCSKSVRIEFSGQETALDRTLIEAIKDPLAHTLRNAIDHGIESPCERFQMGKPEEGLVRLSARQQSGWVIIEVRDNGGGISKQRLIAKAIENGRLTAEQAALMTDREAMELVFEPGFSTAAEVTHISGRGVGMDVVRSQVERAGGSVEVESEVGVGTVVRLRVPLTLAIVPSWTVRVGAHSFCIPQNALLELACVPYRDAEVLCGRVHEAEVYRLRDELLPMVSLDDVLGLPRQRGPLGFYVAVVNVDAGCFALVVDDIVSAEDIVVRPVSPIVRESGIYSGATVLGDGEVAMVLDMPAVAGRAGMRNQGRRAVLADKIAARVGPTVLLAEMQQRDRSVQRVAFPIAAVERIERVSSASIQRIDGRLIMPYRREVLMVEDGSGLFESTDADEVTLLICPLENGVRRGVLVSRVLEVAAADVTGHRADTASANVALLNDRLTVMHDERFDGTATSGGWKEVA